MATTSEDRSEARARTGARRSRGMSKWLLRGLVFAALMVIVRLLQGALINAPCSNRTITIRAANTSPRSNHLLMPRLLLAPVLARASLRSSLVVAIGAHGATP